MIIQDGRALLIAEVGNNHEGSFDAAKRLVDAAAKSGVDAIKFQTFAAARFVSPADPARLKRLRSFELTPAQFRELAKRAKDLGLLFISTPLDLESADVLAPLVDAYKIASGDNDFFPLIERAASYGKPMIISTGISDLRQVARTVAFAEPRAKAGLALMHCVSSYPVPEDQANLLSIQTLARRFPKIPVGYSDHTLGIEASVLSVAVGARIVEKHFTLDKNTSDFRDHALSADPKEMAELVRRVRQAEALLGLPGKVLQACEAGNHPAIRRSAAAARALKAGARLKAGDIVFLRPGGGFSARRASELSGRRLARAVAKGHILTPADLGL